jgi:hypothetical protein
VGTAEDLKLTLLGLAAGSLRLFATAACRLRASQSALKHGGGTTHTRADIYGVGRTVKGTCPTFNAGVSVNDGSLAFMHLENGVRTHYRTHLAPDALVRMKPEGDNIPEISETQHSSPPYKNLEVIHMPTPIIADISCMGTAIRISFFTPDSEV